MRDIIKESEKIQEEIKEKLNSDPDLTITKNELDELIQKLENKLEECGSHDLVSKFALRELLSQSYTMHNDEHPESENPFGLFILGKFLNHNNLTKPALEADFQEIYLLLIELFKKNRNLEILNSIVNENSDPISFYSKGKKILDDNNPHVFPKQKKEYVESIFKPFDGYFEKEFGFTINDAYNITKLIHERLDIILKDHSKKVAIVKKDLIEKYQNDESAQKFLQENQMTFENWLAHASNYLFFVISSSVLTINLEELSTILKLDKEDRNHLKNYLNCFSCTFGDQFNDFKTPADENVIYYKPIIKLDENTFFVCRPDVLEQKLDVLIEYLLLDQKTEKSKLWATFTDTKSSYVEEKTFQWLRKVFGQKNVFRNLYYFVGTQRMEIDVLVLYDDKILLFEAKSGFIPVISKIHGDKMERRLEDLIKKPYEQNLSAQRYISSNSVSEFWNQDKTRKILTIKKKAYDFEFLFINVTLEMLGGFFINLKDMIKCGFYEEGTDYPWSVYFFNFEIILDVLKDPIIFIHYMKERMRINAEGIIESIDELSYLGYYLKNGNLKIEHSADVGLITLASDFMTDLEKHYFGNEKKPVLPITSKIKKQLKILENKQNLGFVDEGSYLLDDFFDDLKTKP